MIILYATSQIQSEQYDEAEETLEEGTNYCSEGLTLANLYLLLCIRILLQKENDGYLFNAKNDCNKAFLKNWQIKCVQGWAKAHLLEIIIFSQLIKGEIEEDLYDEDLSMNKQDMNRAISDFKFRMEQVIGFDNRSASKEVFEYI